MKPLSRRSIALALRASETRGLDGPPLEAVFTDTRRPVEGGLFVALVGPNHDAHDHLAEALAAGAGGLVVSRGDAVPDDTPGGTFVVVVGDTLAALRDLAVLVRGGLKARTVAVTGSVGKTTVKDMVAAALRTFGRVGRSPGNWNNEVGVPLSLFSMRGDERFMVLELGMSAPGEIASLTRVAMPSVGVVTAATAAHLEFFPDVDAIADAKAELWESLPPGGKAVACADDPRVLERARRIRPRGLITYGLSEEADVRVVAVEQGRDGLTARVASEDDEVTVRLRALGRHNAVNAAGALAVTRVLGLPFARAASSLEEHFEPEAHRLVVATTPDGLTVLDDCYNANPASARAALATLGEVAAGAAARGAVLGSMLELGDRADDLHREVGRAAAEAGVTWLAATGPHADALVEGARSGGVEDVRTAGDAADLVDDLQAFAGPDRWLLLKGSRGQRLERLLEPLGAGGET
ncbi:MAG: UDP-N-acetylmuramoyl-tripeptide--D-alanyl-D-alanine ligase [Myxococcota bacterium]